jgi:hypothetical protein
MKKATIIHHQGFGDLFTNNSLCNYFSDKFDELVIFVFDESRKNVVSEMYKHKKNIKCVIPKFIDNNIYNTSCIICMTSGNNPCRLETSFNNHKYIDYSEWKDYENIKIGCFKENYDKWEAYLTTNLENNISFSHSFYLYENLSLDIRNTFFSVCRNNELESENYSHLIGKEYIVLHDDPNRNINIDRSRLPKNLFIYELNYKSKSMIDQIKILENAKELHFIDSSYSVLIYFLSLTNEKIKKIPKYFHFYARKNDMIYKNPTPNNWNILT